MRTAFALPLLAIALLGCSERVQLPPCRGPAVLRWDADHGVAYHTELQVAMRCSRETGRPVLVLFDAYAQSNRACWEVLGNRTVQALIRDRLVLCVLMVDDKKAIAPEDLVDFPQLKSNPTTIGQRNMALEAEFFERQSQPLFTLVNADFVSLAEPMGYVPKKKTELLVNWIEAALERHP
jgi:hypothetical protein